MGLYSLFPHYFNGENSSLTERHSAQKQQEKDSMGVIFQDIFLSGSENNFFCAKRLHSCQGGCSVGNATISVFCWVKLHVSSGYFPRSWCGALLWACPVCHRKRCVARAANPSSKDGVLVASSCQAICKICQINVTSEVALVSR